MARGKTDVRYFGGIKAGQLELQVNTRFMIKRHSVFHEEFFAIDSKGNTALLKGQSKRSLWDHHLVDIYEKMPSKKGVPGMSYEFVNTEIMFRCNAMTKSGKRCKNESDSSRVCKTHQRAESFDLFKHSFNFVELK
jgi:hypothetical protein